MVRGVQGAGEQLDGVALEFGILSSSLLALAGLLFLLYAVTLVAWVAHGRARQGREAVQPRRREVPAWHLPAHPQLPAPAVSRRRRHPVVAEQRRRPVSTG